MIKLASKILNNAVNGFVAGAEARQKIKAAQAEAETKLLLKAADSREEWEKVMAANSARSWKDEFILIVFSLPLIIFPFAPEQVRLFFSYLTEAPDWWVQIWVSMALASFGIRFVPKNIFSRLFRK